MTPRVTVEDRARAIELLQALASATDSDAYVAARFALLNAGLPWFMDPIGVDPCPADDPDAGYGLTLGCPSTAMRNAPRAHVKGHASTKLLTRFAHVDRIARSNTAGGAA